MPVYAEGQRGGVVWPYSRTRVRAGLRENRGDPLTLCSVVVLRTADRFSRHLPQVSCRGTTVARASKYTNRRTRTVPVVRPRGANHVSHSDRRPVYPVSRRYCRTVPIAGRTAGSVHRIRGYRLGRC